MLSHQKIKPFIELKNQFRPALFFLRALGTIRNPIKGIEEKIDKLTKLVLERSQLISG
jgi:hypothetical protein